MIDQLNNPQERKLTKQRNSEYSLIKSIKSLIRSLFGYNNSSFEESVDDLIEEYNADGLKIGKEERKILHNILSFGELTVSDIMIPRTDIVAIEENISFEDLKNVFITQEHTRMPVYKESLDNILGFIHIKDLLNSFLKNENFEIENIIRELLIISPSMKVIDLLIKMRQSRVHMAVVLDEYGGTDGLVTIEDLVEEIVGEIQDEHDDMVEPEIILLDENTIEASARLDVEKLEKQFDLDISYGDNNFDTLGGLVIAMLGYIPVKGEKIMYDAGIEFTIIDSDARKVNRLLIHRKLDLDKTND